MRFYGALSLSRHNGKTMPKLIPQAELDAVLHAVAQFPEGGAVEDIGGVLEVKLRRVLFRSRLALLVEQKWLTVEGRARGSRYRLPAIINEARIIEGADKLEARGEAYIPISSEGEVIKQAVRQPIQNRRPVGYNRAFLDAYRPNDSFYLTPAIRQQLRELSHSPDGQRPAGTYARQVFSRLLIDLSWNSSRLEGNTYSLLETERLLELGEVSASKDIKEAQMILNHKAAIEFMIESADYIQFNQFTILNLHALLSDGLLTDPRACGSLRSISVGIGSSVYKPL